MSIADTLLPEFDQEMATTRRVIERVPDDDPNWKPHPKSFSIAHLAEQVLPQMRNLLQGGEPQKSARALDGVNRAKNTRQ